MSSFNLRRLAFISIILAVFLLIITLSERGADFLDSSSSSSSVTPHEDDPGHTTAASRRLGDPDPEEEHHDSAKHKHAVDSPKQQNTWKKQGDDPNNLLAGGDGNNNKSPAATTAPRSTLPLPDFRTADDHPNDDFSRIKSHFEMSGGNNKFPLPIAVRYIRQIHHGIYEVRGMIPDMFDGGANDHEEDNSKPHHEQRDSGVVTFAFKTECRPAAKWHGQQGYPEILVNWVVEHMFGARFIGSFTPGAVGGLVRLPKKFEEVIHKDGCGFLTEEQVGAMYVAGRDDSRKILPPLAEGERVLIGAVLQWKPRHDDDAIPGGAVLGPFRVMRDKEGGARRHPFRPGKYKQQRDEAPPALSSSSSVSVSGYLPPLPIAPPAATITARIAALTTRASVLQISDIFVLDYVLGNEDRLEKNWFRDEQKRFIAMDNGWALAGYNYAGSVCDLDETNLRCPPLFRKLAGKKCKGRGVSSSSVSTATGEVASCRFRFATVQSVKALVDVLELTSGGGGGGRKSSEYSLASLFARDPLLTFLTKFFNKVVLGKSKKDQGSKKKRPWSDALARYVDGCPMKKSELGGDVSVQELVDMVQFGLLTRARRLLQHVEECTTQFGEAAVLF